MDHRRLLLAVFLSWVLVFAWSQLFGPRGPQELPPAPGETEPERSEPRSGDGVSERPAGGTLASAEVGTTEEEPSAPIEAVEESLVRIEAERFSATFTNRGAQLVSFLLKEQLDAAGEPMDLVRQRSEGPFPFALVRADGEPLAINQALFVAERQQGEDGATLLSFAYAGERGRARKSFRLTPQGLLRFEIELERESEWAVFFGPGVSNPSAEKLEQAQFWRGAAYRDTEGEIERVDARKGHEREELRAGSLVWAALDDQYFMTAVIPGSGATTVELAPYLISDAAGGAGVPTPMPEKDDLTADQKEQPKSLALLLHGGGERISGSSYWGAKVFDQLADLGYGLEGAINYGWFSFLARPLQIGLNYLHDRLVHNYGWAIVLMTILIKLVLLPLTHKSMTSARKMQVLNPKVQAIRARYRNKLKDPKGRPNLEMQRKMQDEIMGLYKTEGVNPAGGCLPVLLQIPIFFSFYQLLGTAIELRNAPWIGWIQDLSSMDPHYVLPLVMFGTQFIQQLRMPMGTDPMQRRLFLLMPFLFLFIFLKFPSGLVLYWLTNNVFSILQQEAYLLWRKRTEEADSTHTTPRTKRSAKA